MHNHIFRRRLSVSAVGILILALLLTMAPAAFGAAEEGTAGGSSAGTAVFVIPVKQTIESGLLSFLERAYKEAEEADAERVVLVISTLGGRVDSAEAIGSLIRGSSVPTVAFIEGKAISAGAYIAINAQQIVMQPGSTIGAAAVVDGSGDLVENPKTVSYWVGEMKKAAEFSGRNPDVAIAMADPGQRIELPELGKTVERGEILTLTAGEAMKVGYADHLAGTVEEALAWLELDQRTIVEFGPSIAERVAGFLTQPGVMFLLLVIGIAGIVIEMLVPGFGVPGFTGLIAFGLFFFGHYIAGFAGMESVVLFIVGIALLIVELFVPSFGILGILGAIALVSGVATAAYDTGNAVVSLSFAFVVALIIAGITAYVFRRRGIWNKFILSDRLTSEQGYLSGSAKPELAGREGVALTPLRPSGTIEVDGERIDAVTEGDFILSGRPIVITKVEGTRVIVREVK